MKTPIPQIQPTSLLNRKIRQVEGPRVQLIRQHNYPTDLKSDPALLNKINRQVYRWLTHCRRGRKTWLSWGTGQRSEMGSRSEGGAINDLRSYVWGLCVQMHAVIKSSCSAFNDFSFMLTFTVKIKLTSGILTSSKIILFSYEAVS